MDRKSEGRWMMIALMGATGMFFVGLSLGTKYATEGFRAEMRTAAQVRAQGFDVECTVPECPRCPKITIRREE